MATPLYDALVDKVRDWSNRPEAATIPDAIVEDCLRYGADDLYRELRIPPLEFSRTYTVGASDNNANDRYTVIPIPSDMTAFIMLRPMDSDGGRDSPYVFNQVTDVRTFLDKWAEQYSCVRYMWRKDEIWISPQQAEGVQLEIYYYRRLPALDATFTVVASNWVDGFPLAEQEFLEADATTSTFLWLVDLIYAFDTEAEADAYILLNGGTKTSVELGGKEAPNWMRDSNERLLIWASLKHIGAYLEDDKMEAKYEKKVANDIFRLNNEEKFRRASGGNVQVNINSGGLI
jgi:hypothetical protein